MTYTSVEKWRPFNCFSLQERVGNPTGPDPENRVGDQDIGSPGRPVSSALEASGESGYCRDLPAAFSLQNVLQLHQERLVILRVDSLAFGR